MKWTKLHQKIIRRFTRIIHFFPIKLLIIHLKENFLLLSFWLILFLIISSLFGKSLGIPNLFLAPEYKSQINELSYSFLGFLTGAFIIAFNISSYELNSHKFPFLASLGKPFIKYVLNNSIVPLLYLVSYTYFSIKQIHELELLSTLQIVLNILSFWVSCIIIVVVSIYFLYINNRVKQRKIIVRKFKETKLSVPINQIIDKELKWRVKNRPTENKGIARVETYLYSPFKIKRARRFEHYPESILNKVFENTHKNATKFALLILLLILFTNVLSSYTEISMPAGAGIILTFTAILLLFSAIHSLFKSWSWLVFLFLFLITNSFSNIFDSYNYTAYGLNYDKQSDNCALNNDFNSQKYFEDFAQTITILENWKKKNKKQKPAIIIINASGGGMKLSYWTYLALAKADSTLNGELLKHTFLINGSSGGFLGASYLRELYLQQQENKIENYFTEKYLENLSKDLLNPIIFKLAISDWFLHFNKFEYKGKKYFKDRAYAFEYHLNKNTNFILDKTILSYREPEKKAIIPLLIASPTILNDGRQLLISAQDINFLTQNQEGISENIEFRDAYKSFNADSLRFSTAIRMSATFPYISPLTILPGQPQLGVIDAGLRDNLGFGISLQFINIFRNWLAKNVSNIIIIQLYETSKTKQKQYLDIIDKIIMPAGSVYSNLFNMQKLNNQRMVQIINADLKQKIQIIPLSFSDDEGKTSLSWRLYKKEKQFLKIAIQTEEFQRNINKLKVLLN